VAFLQTHSATLDQRIKKCLLRMCGGGIYLIKGSQNQLHSLESKRSEEVAKAASNAPHDEMITPSIDSSKIDASPNVWRRETHQLKDLRVKGDHTFQSYFIYEYLFWFDMIWYYMMIDTIWFDLIWYDVIWYDLIWYDMMWYDIFVNCNWVVTRWQKYSTHLHTNST
jgi:hypothetical protein